MSSALKALGWNDRLDGLWSMLDRPDLEPGRVVAQHRGSLDVLTASGTHQAAVAGSLQHRAAGAEDLPAVGDWVGLRPGLIEAVLPRSGALLRKVAGERSEVQVLAANVDTTLVVASLTSEVNVRRLERFTTLGWEGGAPPLIVLTKLDLVEDARVAVADAQAALRSVPVIAVSNVTGEGFDQLDGYLEGTPTLAALGPSGVGKSTLINRLLGGEPMATAEVRWDGKGRHTTTHRQLLPLPGGGALIDTPGLREIGLTAGTEGIETTFDDIASLAAQCRFPDCSHDHEPGCAVKEGVDEARLKSYNKQLREAAALARKVDTRLARAESRKWNKMYKDAMEVKKQTRTR